MSSIKSWNDTCKPNFEAFMQADIRSSQVLLNDKILLFYVKFVFRSKVVFYPNTLEENICQLK